MNYAISVVHSVADLVGAVNFLCIILGFQQKEIAKKAVIVENGVITIRLIESAVGLRDSTLTLEFQTQDFNNTLRQLLAYEGIRLLHQDADFQGRERIEALLHAPHGLNILLVQEFDEDQRGIMPPLPTQLFWDEDADLCTRKMLKLVPVTFRQSARIRVTERAEMLCGETGSVTVSLDIALQALAQTTPLFQRPSLLEALQHEGIDPSNYFDDPIS